MFGKEYGVTIGNIHTYKDLGLILTDKKISTAKPKTKYVEVPGRNGKVDMSEVNGPVKYENRDIALTFYVPHTMEDWSVFVSNLQNKIQGQKVRIVVDDDPAFYYYGRVWVDEFASSGRVGYIYVKADVEPYKYNITTSAEDWLWDPFDFEEGVINEMANMTVEGTLVVSLVCNAKYECPIIIASEPMTLLYGGNTYELVEGSQVMYDIILSAGTQELTFKGKGTVTINYVGGSL